MNELGKIASLRRKIWDEPSNCAAFPLERSVAACTSLSHEGVPIAICSSHFDQSKNSLSASNTRPVENSTPRGL